MKKYLIFSWNLTNHDFLRLSFHDLQKEKTNYLPVNWTIKILKKKNYKQWSGEKQKKIHETFLIYSGRWNLFMLINCSLNSSYPTYYMTVVIIVAYTYVLFNTSATLSVIFFFHFFSISFSFFFESFFFFFLPFQALQYT